MEWTQEENRLIGEITSVISFIDGFSEEISFDYELDNVPKQIYLMINDSEKSYECLITEYQTKDNTCKFKIKNDIDCTKSLNIKIIVVEG